MTVISTGNGDPPGVAVVPIRLEGLGMTLTRFQAAATQGADPLHVALADGACAWRTRLWRTWKPTTRFSE